MYSPGPDPQEKILANDSAENEQKKALTPGERLAAAQAAKAARKAAARGREAEELEEKALAQAAVARDWMQENLKPILIGAGTVVLLAALVLGWKGISQRRDTAAGSELAAVLDSIPEDSRSLAPLLDGFRSVSEAHPDTPAALWARLGEGKALYEQGDFASSRTAYEKALAGARTEDELVRWLAIEGIAYSYEAEQSYEKAIEELEGLRALGKEVSPIARYQQGRLLMTQGKSEEASERLEAALAELNDEETMVLPFTRQQVEARLAVMDRSDTRSNEFDAQQLEQLIQQQQALQPAR